MNVPEAPKFFPRPLASGTKLRAKQPGRDAEASIPEQSFRTPRAAPTSQPNLPPHPAGVPPSRGLDFPPDSPRLAPTPSYSSYESSPVNLLADMVDGLTMDVIQLKSRAAGRSIRSKRKSSAPFGREANRDREPPRNGQLVSTLT